MKYAILILSLALTTLSCTKNNDVSIPNNTQSNTKNEDDCYEKSLNREWVKTENGKTWLYGGDGATEQDFDISFWKLRSCRLRFGIGREAFQALITSKYQDITETSTDYQDHDKCIYTISDDNNVTVYPYKLMREHEVINETIDGDNIMIAYCILADLAVVYSREYCGKTLTFALSGYTYSDPDVWDGIDAFVMWDRETESLWWPLNNEAVSGKMINTSLHKYSGNWGLGTYKELLGQYPSAKILRFGQSMKPPVNWPRTDNPCK